VCSANSGPKFFSALSFIVLHSPRDMQVMLSSHTLFLNITCLGPHGQLADGSILPRNSTIQLPGRDDIWAPDVSFHNGEYYAYYAVSTFGSQDSGIGLATSKTMEPGTWTDHGLVFNSTTGDDFNAIDPNLSIDEHGNPILSFVTLARNLKTVTSIPVQGAFIWKHESFFYLFISSGLCCGFVADDLPPPGNEYKVFVGRSKSAHGPFLDKSGVDMRETGGTLVLGSHGNIYAPGGQAVFTDKKTHKDVFVYHYVPVDSPSPYNDSFSSLGLNGIDWSSGWPVLIEL
ncbi:glycosyl hydrolase, partial [Mycena sp. CBHHK59/15]